MLLLMISTMVTLNDGVGFVKNNNNNYAVKKNYMNEKKHYCQCYLYITYMIWLQTQHKIR